MSVTDFASNPVSLNLFLFLIAAVLVWFAGQRMTNYVDVLADRTRMGKAFAGALLLGGATSLPELATTITASLSGAAEMAGTNLLGGIVMQIAILAVMDAIFLRGRALTFFSPQSALLMEGVLLMLIISLVIAAMASGELFSIAGVGFWPLLLGLTCGVGLWVLYRYDGDSRWVAAGAVGQPPASAQDLMRAMQERFQPVSTRALGWRFGLAAVFVLLGGVLVATTGEVLAGQLGISQGFVGASLVAIATSLPEISTTYSAVRMGAYSLAASNILGTNILEVGLFLPAEVTYRGGPIINEMPKSAIFLAAMGLTATAVYLWGILERRNQTLFGMGIDSVIVLAIYLGGMTLFFFL